MLTRSLLLTCCCLAATVATAMEIAAPSPDWDAQWIWQAADGPANSWMAFRKTFDLDKAPDEAVANIAVDSKYWIWINGRLARFEGGSSWDNAVEKGQPPAEPWGDLELNHVPPLNDRGLAYYENYPATSGLKERYQGQIDNLEVTTLDEYLGVREGGTYNHAWNAPNFILSRYYAGIGPDSAGWSTYHVMPTMLDLTSIRHRVPSVKGDIAVEISKGEKSFDLELVSPTGTMATVGIPKSIGRIAQVTVNRETVWDSGRSSESAQGITKAGEDDSYLMFRIPSGKWNVSATAL